MCRKMIPGTKISYTDENIGFSYFAPLIRATDGLTLSQVCTLTGLETSTIQNWVKRGFVPHPVNKLYRERHLARILLISALRDSMQIDRVGELLRFINGDTDDESDDIISEEALYDIFCSLIGGVSENVFVEREIDLLIVKATEDYEPPDEMSLIRIRKALTVMAYAYISGMFKKKCDEEFQKLR
ncbi:MAG: DUF1836 domain-containing protein [Ruminococcus sp.]|nr:DUF1836 domain-containing protein [Ruminococcus sp.]